MKVCKKCEIEKSEDEFYANGGFTCKDCANKASKLRYSIRHDEIRQQAKKYRSKNKDKIRERAKIGRIKNNHSKYSNEKRKEYTNDLKPAYIRSLVRSKGIENSNITEDIEQKVKAAVLSKRIKKILELLGYKICEKCNQQKELSDFSVKYFVWKGKKKSTIPNLCKKCENKRTYEYKKKSNENNNASKKSSV